MCALCFWDYTKLLIVVMWTMEGRKREGEREEKKNNREFVYTIVCDYCIEKKLNASIQSSFSVCNCCAKWPPPTTTTTPVPMDIDFDTDTTRFICRNHTETVYCIHITTISHFDSPKNQTDKRHSHCVYQANKHGLSYWYMYFWCTLWQNRLIIIHRTVSFSTASASILLLQ